MAVLLGIIAFVLGMMDSTSTIRAHFYTPQQLQLLDEMKHFDGQVIVTSAFSEEKKRRKKRRKTQPMAQMCCVCVEVGTERIKTSPNQLSMKENTRRTQSATTKK